MSGGAEPQYVTLWQRGDLFIEATKGAEKPFRIWCGDRFSATDQVALDRTEAAWITNIMEYQAEVE